MSAGDLVIWPNGGLEFPVNYREQSWGFRWTSPFGMRTHPVTGVPETFHYGLDLIGWSIIKSPYTGTVTFSGYNGGAGNEVRIREDGTGDYVRLMHNSALWVKSGQRVTQGQDVAVMGTTGSSTGVHCHEEIHPGGGAAVDPMQYYRNRNSAAAGGGSAAAGGGSNPFNPTKEEKKVTLYARTTEGIVYAVPEGGPAYAYPSLDEYKTARALAIFINEKNKKLGIAPITVPPTPEQLVSHLTMNTAQLHRLMQMQGSR